MYEKVTFLKRTFYLIFVAVLPFWPILSSLALIPVITLQVFFPKKNSSTLSYSLLWFIVPFIGYAISFVYSYDMMDAGLYMIRILPMLLVPLLILFADKESIPARQALKSWFIYGMLISAGFAIILSFFSFLRTGSTEVFTYYDLAENMKLHPTYYSLFSLTALYFLWSGGFNTIFRLLGTSVLILLILLLQSKIAFFILILLIVLHVLLYWKSFKTRAIMIIALVLISVLFTVKFSGRISKDLKGLVQYDETLIGTLEENGITQRVWLLKEAIPQIADKPILGYGLKSQRTLFGWKVHKKGLRENISPAYREASWIIAKLNMHNQYLQILYEGGIVGLFMFVFPLVMIAINAYKAQNWIYLIAHMVFILILVTENLLDRQMGIYYYAVFLPLLYAVRDKPLHPLIVKHNIFRV